MIFETSKVGLPTLIFLLWYPVGRICWPVRRHEWERGILDLANEETLHIVSIVRTSASEWILLHAGGTKCLLANYFLIFRNLAFRAQLLQVDLSSSLYLACLVSFIIPFQRSLSRRASLQSCQGHG